MSWRLVERRRGVVELLHQVQLADAEAAHLRPRPRGHGRRRARWPGPGARRADARPVAVDASTSARWTRPSSSDAGRERAEASSSSVGSSAGRPPRAPHPAQRHPPSGWWRPRGACADQRPGGPTIWRASRSRMSDASAERERAMATPGSPPDAVARPAARDASARPRSTSNAAMSRAGTGPSRNLAERLATVGRMVAGSSAQSTMQASPDGLLERLEQRVLGIRVQPMGRLHDSDADASLHGQERQVRDERLDLGDPDLLPGTLRLEPVEVGVVAVLHLATGGARTTGPRRWLR